MQKLETEEGQGTAPAVDHDNAVAVLPAQEQEGRRLDHQRILEAAKQNEICRVDVLDKSALLPFTEGVRQWELSAQDLGASVALVGAIGGIGGIDLTWKSYLAMEILSGVQAVQQEFARTAIDTLRAAAEQAIGAVLEMTRQQMLVQFTWPTQPAPRRLLTPSAPAQLPAEPKAAEAISTVHLSGGSLEEAIVLAVTGGKVQKARLIKLLMSLPDQPAPGCTPPDWQDIQAVALLYKERGHDCTSQQGFIQRYLEPRGYVMDIRTFQRWISDYEMLTGEKIRPGRGRRKRPQPKRRSM